MPAKTPAKTPALKTKKNLTKKSKSLMSLGELQRAKEAAIKQHRGSKKTQGDYARYVQRGKDFLEALVAEKRKNEDNEGLMSEATWINLDELEKCFSNPPNKLSAMALENFLVQKCLTEDLGVNTASGIHAAFIRYWDDMCGETYRGPYQCNPETGKVLGNPARAAATADLMKSIKNKCRADGGRQTHAEAITLENMKAVWEWSEKQCPTEWLTKIEDAAELKKAKRHVLMRAFMASGFTLWTRNFELCAVQRQHIEFDCEGPAPYCTPHFRVRLVDRKGWQKKQGEDGPLESNTYEIYEQRRTPEIDMYTSCHVWVTFLEGQLGRQMESDDYLFPYIGSNGVIYPKKLMTHDIIQKYLTEFTVGAGLTKHFTTHCLRRGGAQYRFMFAPIGERWSLSIIRWWGGWALGEHVRALILTTNGLTGKQGRFRKVDTLIRYLVDSLQSYETGHGDALRPVPTEKDRSFNGDHVLLNPVTAAEVREMTAAVDRKFGLVADMITKLSIGPRPPGPAQSKPAGGAENVNVHHKSPCRRFSSPSGQTATAESDSGTHPDEDQQHSPSPVSPVTPGLLIRNLSRGSDAWREAVKQWNECDPISGLPALKDWPHAWYSKQNKTAFASKRMQRQKIAEAFELCNLDDSKFRDEYPEADQSIKKLLAAIHRNNITSGKSIARTSKNGTPEQRQVA